MYRLLIKNIGLLQTPVGSFSHKGEAQGENLKLKDACIYAEDGIIKEINLQEIDRMQWERWLHHGQSMSYEKFWGEPYGGRN